MGQALGVTRKRKRGSPFHPSEFWQYVDRRGADECWLWQDTIQARNGYGAFWHSELRRTFSAHRLAWVLTRGETGHLHVLHTCDNPRCCNVAHLYLGTPKQNAHDRVTRGRQANGWTGKRAS